MKRCPLPRHFLFFALPLLLLSLALWTVLPVPSNIAAVAPPSPQQRLRRAWRQAQEIGAYDFSSEIVQITYPAPAVVNAGRGSRRDTFFLQGTMDRQARVMELTLWQNEGNITTSRGGIDVRIEDGKAYGRAQGGVWQEIEDFSGSFAPGGDPLAFLAAIKNVEEITDFGVGNSDLGFEDVGIDGGDAKSTIPNAQSEIRQYTFKVDGPAFAEYLRGQLEEQLRRGGELPPGLTLQTPRQFVGMTGEGDISLGARGLPLRLRVHLTFPPDANGERIEADITTNFGFENASFALTRPPISHLQSVLGNPKA
ncbi:hypothetical protein D6833_03640, partial [Candidatus Parcubacteria bacterium]